METIDVQKVMEEIRTEVRHRKAQLNTTKSVRYGTESDPSLAHRKIAYFDMEPNKISPSLKFKEQGYHIQDFLQYHDRQFVINAYTGILNRLPDPQGLDNYLDNLRRGRMSKTDILCYMRDSAEGKAMGIKVKGLGQACLLNGLCKIPILGYVFKLFIGIVNLPRVLRDIQIFDAQSSYYKDNLLRVQAKLN
jgi:hypothetical protein